MSRAAADALLDRGLDLMLRGESEVAHAHFAAAIAEDPNFVPAMSSAAAALAQGNKLTPARALLERVVAITPEDGVAWSNLGNIRFRQEDYTAAYKALLRATELAPEDANVWHNLALLCGRTGKYVPALKFLDKAEEFRKSPTITNDRAHIYLAMGDLARGFEHYEARWELMRHLAPWDFRIPEWKGEDLDGKEILFHAEQGFGDTIMASRFARDLYARGAEVTVAVPAALVRLFSHQSWGVDVIDLDDLDEIQARKFHFHSPMWSAMRWLGIEKNSIDSKPYMQAPESPTPRSGFFDIGICWASGRRGGSEDWRRRISNLEDWIPLAANPRVRLVSLMKEPEFDLEISTLGADALVENPRARLVDWAATAALINDLDIVITVDTAVAHLSAALGRPTWMLSQFTPCWRWWEINSGSGRPWYQTMRIVKQTEPNGWKEQLSRVRADLEVALDNFYFLREKGGVDKVLEPSI